MALEVNTSLIPFHGILLSGQSGSGKSAVVEVFEQQCFHVKKEAARALHREYSTKNGGKDLWEDRSANALLYKRQKNDLIEAIKSKKVVVFDRSFIDTKAFENVYPGVYDTIKLSKSDIRDLKNFTVNTIFFLLPSSAAAHPHQGNKVNEFDQENNCKIAKAIKATYLKHNFTIIDIPWIEEGSEKEAVEKKAKKIYKLFQDRLRRVYSDRDVAIVNRVMQCLPRGNPNTMQTMVMYQSDSKYNIWGIAFKEQQRQVPVLREELFKKFPNTKRIVQYVGDCELFSLRGTQFSLKVTESYIKDPSNIITFGHSGLFKEGKRDVNGIAIELVERHSAQNRLVSNVVGDCVKAIENWGFRTCRSLVNNMVVVYNHDGTHTKFGDDVIISDNIMQNRDEMLLLEGGAQSLLQSLNALKQGVNIVALTGLREKVANLNDEKFSTARFFQMAKVNNHQDIETILDQEIKKQLTWKPHKLTLLDRARALLRDPSIQEKIMSSQIVIKTMLPEEEQAAVYPLEQEGKVDEESYLFSRRLKV